MAIAAVVVIACFPAVVFAAEQRGGSVVVVAADETGDFRGDTGEVIQQAVDAVKGGGTVVIQPGTYRLTRAVDLSGCKDVGLIGVGDVLLRAAARATSRSTI